MRHLVLLLLPLAAACNFQLPHYSDDDGAADASLLDGTQGTIDGPPGTYHVGGQVEGMWDGAAVALRLQSTDVDDIKSVTANASFNFNMVLDDGASYTVSVETQPEHHTCDITNGAGNVNGADVSSIIVSCTGPTVDIALGAPISWSFDSETTAYDLDASVLVRETTAKVTAPLVTSIEVNGSAVASGTTSAPVPLALGANAVGVDVAVDSISRHYVIGINRGGAIMEHIVYGKGSNTLAGDSVGQRVAASGDVIVVGAPGQSSASGAVYVFRRTGSLWTQEAFLKASNAQANDNFGASVAISGDFLAVGAPGEASNATGTNSNQTDNSMAGAGAAYIFYRTGTTWTQEAYIKASNTDAQDRFGSDISLDGDTLVVSAPAEAGSSSGIDGLESSNAAAGAGAAYVFRRIGGVWSQEAYVKASNTNANDHFGGSVALDAGTLVVGAYGEASIATGIGGAQTDNSASSAGAAYVFTRAGSTWSQQAYVKASNTDAGDLFGYAIALSGDTMVVGAYFERSNATGVNGDQADDSLSAAGAAYVFSRSGSTWTQQAYVKASNPDGADSFGSVVEVLGDTMVVVAQSEASNATGVGGDQANNTADLAGAAYVFTRNGTTWSQRAYVKASNTGMYDGFGSAVALIRDAMIVGASGENGGTQGLDGDQTDDSAENAGAFYILR